jgi:G3E family GTPase
VLNIEGKPKRVIFQGVHMLFGADEGKPWATGEIRETTMVFIGRRLPRALIEKGLAMCRSGIAADPAGVLS